ncbi:MAG: hypothetical protein SXA11_10660 [Cyanobacteriota bacterium]|nr:hypothetical protein [Cyanobacteriota bacterium]
MNVRQKLLSGLLLSGLMLTSGATAFKAIARETEPVIQTSNEKNIAEYANTCAQWSGQMSKFSRRLTNYGWFDFSDFRWAGRSVEEVDFWQTCMRNTAQFEAGIEILGRDLEDECDRIAKDFKKNFVYFPQFNTLTHEFRTDKIGEEFHAYSCRIVVRPSFESTSVEE